MLALAGIIVAPIDKTLLILPRRELSGHKVELKGKKDNIPIWMKWRYFIIKIIIKWEGAIVYK